MADHVVGRDAQGLGVAAIEQAGRQGAVVEDDDEERIDARPDAESSAL